MKLKNIADKIGFYFLAVIYVVLMLIAVGVYCSIWTVRQPFEWVYKGLKIVTDFLGRLIVRFLPR